MTLTENNSTRAFTTAALVAIIFGTITWINNGIAIMWPWYLSILIAATSLILTIKLSNLSKAQSAAIILSINISAFFASSVTAYLEVKQNINTDFFAAYRFGALLVAIVAPSPVWVCYTVFGMALFIPPLQVLFINPEISVFSSYREPWVTMVYPLVSYIILKIRRESQHTEMMLVESRASEKSLKDFAEVAVALRDLTNTPLQSLDLLTELLNSESITPKQASEYLSKTTYKLHEIIHIFNEYQKNMMWQSGKETLDSFDILKNKFSGKRIEELEQ
jgi:hypothetical protein